MKISTKLRWDATSPASARRIVAGALSSRGFTKGCIETAVLLTSEAVTNAVVHARSEVDLVVVADHPMARVEVYDADPSPPRPRVPDPYATTGRGIHVVEALAEAWGVEQVPGDGKCVWFEVRS